MIIEPANTGDLDDILLMREEASGWLRTRGVEQWTKPWPDHEGQARRILDSIMAGETWMVRAENGVNAATVALDTYADPQLWTPDERCEAAFYLHRLIVRRSHAGLGARILDWACRRAADEDKRWVRIDVWTHNVQLHRYYMAHGFQHVRTLDLPTYPSGALFQRSAS